MNSLAPGAPASTRPTCIVMPDGLALPAWEKAWKALCAPGDLDHDSYSLLSALALASSQERAPMERVAVARHSGLDDWVADQFSIPLGQVEGLSFLVDTVNAVAVNVESANATAQSLASAATQSLGNAGVWRIAPVFHRFLRDHLVVNAIPTESLNGAALSAAVEVGNALAARYGWSLELHPAAHAAPLPRIYLRDPTGSLGAVDTSADVDISISGLHVVNGRNPDRYQPSPKKAFMAWFQFLAEWEMRLFDLPANQGRIQEGLLPLTSFWLCGRCPAVSLAHAVAFPSTPHSAPVANDWAACWQALTQLHPHRFDPVRSAIKPEFWALRTENDPQAWWRRLVEICAPLFAQGDVQLILTGTQHWRSLRLPGAPTRAAKHSVRPQWWARWGAWAGFGRKRVAYPMPTKELDQIWLRLAEPVVNDPTSVRSP